MNEESKTTAEWPRFNEPAMTDEAQMPSVWYS